MTEIRGMERRIAGYEMVGGHIPRQSTMETILQRFGIGYEICR